jgi:hypothetical protein
MNKGTKIVIISGVIFTLSMIGFFVIKRLREPKKGTKKGPAKKSTKTKLTDTTNTQKPTKNSLDSTSVKENVTIDKMPIKPVSIITSSNTPVFVTSMQPTTNSNPIIEQPDLTTSTFRKLDDKLKKLYYILAPVDKKDGVVIYVPAENFTPEYPNQPVGETMKNTLWRVAYNDYKDLVRGFNSEERNQATKNYGNQMLNVFKTLRLDYIFDPQIYNENKAWYKDAEARSIKANVKTDFWKTS